MKFKCPKCGKKVEISKDNLICSKCGYKITKADVQDSYNRITHQMEYNYDDEEFSRCDPDVASCLCLLLGTFGAHRFYLGKYVSATIMLIITISSYVCDFFQISYSFLLLLFIFLWCLFDLYGITQNVYSDGKGKTLCFETEHFKKDSTIMTVLSGALTVIYILITLSPIPLQFKLNAAISGAVFLVYLFSSLIRK